jgi:hypothetical protein
MPTRLAASAVFNLPSIIAYTYSVFKERCQGLVCVWISGNAPQALVP